MQIGLSRDRLISGCGFAVILTWGECELLLRRVFLISSKTASWPDVRLLLVISVKMFSAFPRKK